MLPARSSVPRLWTILNHSEPFRLADEKVNRWNQDTWKVVLSSISIPALSHQDLPTILPLASTLYKVHSQRHAATMTFREEDLLPYQKIDFDKTPEYLKTTFMQWTMLEPYLHEYGGFVKGIHPEKLLNMSLLDRNTGSGGFDDSPCAPADFSAAFGQVVKENELEDARVAARQAELKQMVGMLFRPNNERIREKVEMLITEELKEEKVPERLWIAANMRSKVTSVCELLRVYQLLTSTFRLYVLQISD